MPKKEPISFITITHGHAWKGYCTQLSENLFECYLHTSRNFVFSYCTTEKSAIRSAKRKASRISKQDLMEIGDE